MIRCGGFFWPNSKVIIGWIGNPTQNFSQPNPTQPFILRLGCQILFSFIYPPFIIIHLPIKYIKSSQTNTNQYIIIEKKKKKLEYQKPINRKDS